MLFSDYTLPPTRPPSIISLWLKVYKGRMNEELFLFETFAKTFICFVRLNLSFSVSAEPKLFNESIQGDQIGQLFANWATFGGSFMIF
jgi:hypothetical protein